MPAPSPERDQLAKLRAEVDEIAFVGGEPTLDAGLVDWVRAAKEARFSRIGLQTHGRHLAGDDLVAQLAAAGLTDVHFSLHGATALLHDHEVQVPGAFGQVLHGLEAARSLGLVTVVTSVVTRSSFRHLGALPKLLSAAGASAWSMRIAQAAGRAATSFDRVVPRLGLAMPFVLHALDDAERRGLPTFLAGVPACLAGPFAARLLPEPGRAFAAVCDRCPARPSCPGVEPLYLRRFSGDELRARGSWRPARDLERDLLGRMFTGVGETAPGSPPAHLGGSLDTAGPVPLATGNRLAP